ncbi:MAG: S-methyl-5'-thioadenosine phosphorylase [Planctomycetota bacterium]
MNSDDLCIGIIGGTGIAEKLTQRLNAGELRAHTIDTPFGKPSDDLLEGAISGVRTIFLSRHGPGHTIPPHALPFRANIFALKSLGVTHLVATGAVGSLREDIAPGDVVLVDQFIDRTVHRARTFYDRAAVHVEFAEPCCPETRTWLLAAAKSAGVTVHESGTYVCMEGPSFSTRAESHMHRAMGGDLIGMTAMPEAKLAREAEIAYALLALPTDYDSWRDPEPGKHGDSLLEEIIGNLQRSSATALDVLAGALSDPSALLERPSPAHDALARAIWSDRGSIHETEIDRLHVLWGRHFA